MWNSEVFKFQEFKKLLKLKRNSIRPPMPNGDMDRNIDMFYKEFNKNVLKRIKRKYDKNFKNVPKLR